MLFSTLSFGILALVMAATTSALPLDDWAYDPHTGTELYDGRPLGKGYCSCSTCPNGFKVCDSTESSTPEVELGRGYCSCPSCPSGFKPCSE